MEFAYRELSCGERQMQMKLANMGLDISVSDM